MVAPSFFNTDTPSLKRMQYWLVILVWAQLFNSSEVDLSFY